MGEHELCYVLEISSSFHILHYLYYVYGLTNYFVDGNYFI